MGDASPSWVTPPPEERVTAGATARATPVTLRLAVVATLALAAAQVVHVAGRDELVVGLRVFLVAVVAGQVGLAVAAALRSPAAALALLVCQLTTALASLAGGFGEQRVAFAVGSVVVFALVAGSLGAFPSVPLPSFTQPTDGEGAR